MSIFVSLCAEWAHAFGQGDAFFQCFGDFFVVLAIRGCIVNAFAIKQCDAAPRFDQWLEIRLFAFRFGTLTFCVYGFAVRQKFIEYDGFFLVVTAAHGLLAVHVNQCFVAMQDFFDLHRIIRQQFGCGIHGGQAAADNAGRQTHLQVSQRRSLGGSG